MREKQAYKLYVEQYNAFKAEGYTMKGAGPASAATIEEMYNVMRKTDPTLTRKDFYLERASRARDNYMSAKQAKTTLRALEKWKAEKPEEFAKNMDAVELFNGFDVDSLRIKELMRNGRAMTLPAFLFGKNSVY